MKNLKDKTKGYLRTGAVILVFIFSIFGIIFYKPIWGKIIFGIFTGVSGWILYKTYLFIKRKKYYIEGRVLSIEPPKNKFKVGKTKVIIKGKSSKKLFSWRPITLKVGGAYVFYYEEKSNEIIQYESMKNLIKQQPRPKRSNIPPQYR